MASLRFEQDLIPADLMSPGPNGQDLPYPTLPLGLGVRISRWGLIHKSASNGLYLQASSLKEIGQGFQVTVR